MDFRLSHFSQGILKFLNTVSVPIIKAHPTVGQAVPDPEERPQSLTHTLSLSPLPAPLEEHGKWKEKK